MNGQCQTDCGTGAAVVSHVRRSSSVSAEAFALDQKVSVAAGTEGMSSKVLYFKHGYSAAATASVDTLNPSMQQHELATGPMSTCLLHCQIIVEEMCGRPHPQEHIAPEHS